MFKHLIGILAAGSALVITVAAGVVAIPFVVFGMVMRKLRKKNTDLLVLFFLSSIVAVAPPAVAKGDVNVGVGTTFGRDIPTKPCDNLGMGRLTSGSIYRCYSSLDPIGYPSPAISFKDQKPVPFLIDMSDVLARTTWRLDNVYYPATELPDDKFDYYFGFLCGILVILSLITTYIGLQGWDPNVELDKNKSI